MSERPVVGILGANGFIGSRLVEWLVLHDLTRTRPIVRSYKALARLARFELDCRLADATDQASLENQLRGCQYLFHCVVGSRDVILESIEAAYRAAAAANVQRLVYLSSAVVHGYDPAPETHDDTPLIRRQPAPYAVSKVLAEHRLRRLSADYRVEVVVLRPYIVFGPRSQWTAQIASDLLSGKGYLINGGAGICNAVYVDNLIKAMWQAATNPQAAGQNFLITDGERVTWLDFYATVAKAVGVEASTIPSIDIPMELGPAAGRLIHKLKRNHFARGINELLPWRFRQYLRSRLDPQTTLPSIHQMPAVDSVTARLQRCRYVLPIAKAKRVLGYSPLPFDEGCRRTAEWIRFAFGLENTHGIGRTRQ